MVKRLNNNTVEDKDIVDAKQALAAFDAERESLASCLGNSANAGERGLFGRAGSKQDKRRDDHGGRRHEVRR